MIENDLYQYLSTFTNLTDLVGLRIYPLMFPKSNDKSLQLKNFSPYVTYMKVSNVREMTHQGFASLQKARIQLDCYSLDYYTAGSVIGAKQVAEQVIVAMESWTGQLHIQASLPEGEQDFYDSITKLYRVSLDFVIMYGDPAPQWDPPAFIVDTARKIITFTFQGTLILDTVSARIHFDANINVTKIALHSQDAPTGADVQVDMLIDDVLEGDPATLTDGSRDEETDVTPLIVPTTSEFALKLIQIGSTFPGAGLEVKIFYT